MYPIVAVHMFGDNNYLEILLINGYIIFKITFNCKQKNF